MWEIGFFELKKSYYTSRKSFWSHVVGMSMWLKVKSGNIERIGIVEDDELLISIYKPNLFISYCLFSWSKHPWKSKTTYTQKKHIPKIMYNLVISWRHEIYIMFFYRHLCFCFFVSFFNTILQFINQINKN